MLKHHMKSFYYFISFLLITGIPFSVVAEWTTITHTNTDSETKLTVAFTENAEGYTLEIYVDDSGAVRSRFSTNNIFQNLAEKNCPTFQVDKRQLMNRSINDALCLSNYQWVEFVLGYIENNEIKSTALHNMMNGNKITYRFILESGGYDETEFSLSGSKRILTNILGNNLTVRTNTGYSSN